MFASKAKQLSWLTENEDEGQILHFAQWCTFCLVSGFCSFLSGQKNIMPFLLFANFAVWCLIWCLTNQKSEVFKRDVGESQIPISKSRCIFEVFEQLPLQQTSKSRLHHSVFTGRCHPANNHRRRAWKSRAGAMKN